MVDALRALWSVLTPGGTLVDLRPRSWHCPVEAVMAERSIEIAELDATGMAAEDAAADRAVGRALGNGWFVPRRQETFDFELYWDSVADMASFIESSKRMKELRPAFADLDAKLSELRTRADGSVRLRCRRPTLLAVYRKAMTRSL